MGELIRDTADRWTSQTGHRVNAFAEALRAAGNSLREQGQHRMARWSGSAADEVERMASYLEEEDSRVLLHDLEDVARRNPGAFIGLSFAAGLAVGRFLRASEAGDGNGVARHAPAGTYAPSGTYSAGGADASSPRPGDGRADREVHA